MSAQSPRVFDESSLLWQWAEHGDVSFHHLQPEKAAEIRLALLNWYRSNRRKLPWRGDAPPYNGSTAQVKDSEEKSKKRQGPKTKQTSLNSFLAAKAKPVSSGVQSLSPAFVVSQDVAEVIPVSGYGVWVSEIMLQQTRVEAVIPYYLRWMKRFPTVFDLAEASEEDVNAHWAGLGFYRRARLLHNGAKIVVQKYDGNLPQTVEGLTAITGVGRYTASAIASIAFDVCVPVVDGNVCRVLSRLTGIANNIKAPILKDKMGWDIAEQIVKAGDGKYPGEVNQALMELGATYCSPSGTGLEEYDPLKDYYMSTKLASCFEMERKNLARAGYDTFPIDEFIESASGKETCALCESNKEAVLATMNDMWNEGRFLSSHGPFPLPPPKTSKREEVLAVGAIAMDIEDECKWLLVKRPKEGLLAGQWEFPSVCLWSSITDTKKSKTKEQEIEVPFVDPSIRSKALTNHLESLLTDSEGEISCSRFIPSADRTELQTSEEHVFSHVRHTMWIEHQHITNFTGTLSSLSWTSSCRRQVRWMSKEDMKRVGVTSGVKKILKAVENSFSRKRKR
jgi:A/G-specific adenine glycosylase